MILVYKLVTQCALSSEFICGFYHIIPVIISQTNIKQMVYIKLKFTL